MEAAIASSRWTVADLITMPLKNIKSLQRAIKPVDGCDSKYVDSIPVHEVFRRETAWQGTVEVFDLLSDEKAKRCYACQYEDGKEIETVAILEIPPVDSPESAVRVAIAAAAKR
jgi:hypothetical protein